MSLTKSTLALAFSNPAEEPTDNVNRLGASLGEPLDEAVEAAWLAEVERRLDEVDRGSDTRDPWIVVRARIAAQPGEQHP